MRRVIVSVATIVTIGFGVNDAARADIPKCDDNKKTNCVLGGVIVLDGNELGVSMCAPAAGHVVCKGTVGDAFFSKAAARAAKLIADSGVTTKWDTATIFTANFTPGTGSSDSMLFFRTGGSPETGGDYVNKVARIGIPKVTDYKPGIPWVGYITGSNTAEFGIYKAPPYPPPPGSGYVNWPEPDPASGGFRGASCTNSGYCYGFLYNGYQVLAQATATMYGPRLQAKPPAMGAPAAPAAAIISFAEVGDGGAPDAGTSTPDAGTPTMTPAYNQTDLSLPALAKTGPGLLTTNEARVWSSFVDMESTLMGGNNWVENGNRTAQTGAPAQHWIASPPYQGRQILRFAPLDLYMLGFAPANDTAVPPVKRYSWIINDMVWPQQQYNFSPAYGPGMGLKGTGDVVFYSDGKGGEQVKIADVVAAMGGEREPNFDSATNLHTHRQLWIVVTNPTDDDDTNRLAVVRLARWRVQWSAYFYMLASYQGRMVTTLDDAGGKPVDDNPYWEFAQPKDDVKDWDKVGGLTMEIPGPKPIPSSAVISTSARVNTDGTGEMKYTGARLALRVTTDPADPSYVNTAVVRMKIPSGAPKDAAAHLKLGNLDIRIPASVSNDSKKEAFLIADGQFHNYNADLTKLGDDAKGTFNELSLQPADKAIDGIEVEYIQLKYLDDKQILDKDLDCARAETKGDGWVASEDNCPLHYNPDQQDINGDGVGDACEDFDADNIINACDNCPTKTNSRQRDRDKDGLGDVCDDGQDSGCFLMPDSLGGRGGTRVALPLVLGLAGAIGTLAVRRRRRR